MSSIPGPSQGAPSPRSDDDAPDRARTDAAPDSPVPGERTRRTLAYCSATDRNVPVLVKLARERSERGRPSYREAERLVCLDYGVRCTCWLCPLFDVPILAENDLDEPSGRAH